MDEQQTACVTRVENVLSSFF